MTIKEQFRAIIMVIAAAMLYCTSAAADASGQCGDNLTWNYNSNNKVLTISGTGDMWNYVSYFPTSIIANGSIYEFGFRGSEPWCNLGQDISEVIIGDGVTSVGEGAFIGCSGLTRINIPAGVTSIGKRAFYGCYGLSIIRIDTNNKYYDSRNDCNAIIETATNTLKVGCKSTKIPSSVTSIGEGAFVGSTGLTIIDIPSSVTSIGYEAFMGCIGLASINIHVGVTSIGGSAFEYCAGLTSINIPSSVTSIGERAFYYCSGLTSISLPDGVTSIGGSAFEYCAGLTSINIPSSVTSIGERAFYECSGLMSIDIPSSVTSIGEGAFSWCSGLTSINIPSSVTSIGEDAFGGCKRLGRIQVDANNKTFDSRNGCNAIIETATNTLKAGCKSTKIPDGVTSIGNSAFSGCSGLTSINIPDGVTSIGNSAFSGCSGLTSINIPDGVTSIGDYTFGGCGGLTSINIPGSVTSIGRGAFCNCSGLKLINVLAKTPPKCGLDAFEGVNTQSCKLVVPYESWKLYNTRDPWWYFNIIAGVDVAKADRVNVAAVGGEITITGVDNDAVVEVYGVNGMLVYRGNSKSVPVPSAGVYVVRVAGKTVKVAVN